MHPKQVWLFKKWAEAMIQGANVGAPHYPKTRGNSSGKRGFSRKARRLRRRKKKED